MQELVRKFELAVYEEDLKDDGSISWNQVSYKQPIIIEAKSKADLQEKLNLYKQCGQIAKIVREIDPPTKQQIEEYIQSKKQTQENQKTDQTTSVNQENIQEQKTNNIQDDQNVKKTTEILEIDQKNESIKKDKPKYYRVGDIEIKNDNGKIYQKQWMKLTNNESSNIRLINDKTNALVNITGKHFEIKRWILVESSDEIEAQILDEVI